MQNSITLCWCHICKNNLNPKLHQILQNAHFANKNFAKLLTLKMIPGVLYPMEKTNNRDNHKLNQYNNNNLKLSFTLLGTKFPSDFNRELTCLIIYFNQCFRILNFNLGNLQNSLLILSAKMILIDTDPLLPLKLQQIHSKNQFII